MTHTPSRGSSAPSNEADNGLGVLTGLVVLLKVLSSLLLHTATNLANNNDTLRAGVVEEQFDDVDVLRAREGVTADADDERLAETNASRLCDGLVCERAGTGDDTCRSLLTRARG